MPSYEIERKFLVDSLPEELPQQKSKRLRQGYLASGEDEVRIRHDQESYTLTCKRGHGLKREEREIEITQKQFDALWPLTETCRVEKTRYLIPAGKLTIELDVYHGRHRPLIVAEVEFDSVEESQKFSPPLYFGVEVTKDQSYKNRQLAQNGLPISNSSPASASR
ncbi:adenylate cyclase [Verrucomicrobiia bacterium DG1235]|nr:adenylate cyclase [Verrucomicrobiae bacterium DG1235]